MPKVIFVTPNGERVEVDATVGLSLMEAAVAVGSCATCHVRLDSKGFELVGEAGALESSLLKFAEDVDDYSRLSCQIKVTENIDGLLVTVP